MLGIMVEVGSVHPVEKEGLVIVAIWTMEEVYYVFLIPKQTSKLGVWDKMWVWVHSDDSYILQLIRHHFLKHFLKTPQPSKAVRLAWNQAFK